MSIPTDIAYDASYVLGLRIEPYTLTLRMDFALTPAHRSYVAPPATEQECYARGQIRIGGFEKLTWQATQIVASRDSTGECDFGNLDEFTLEDGVWKLVCDAGVIELTGGVLSLSME